MNSDKQLYVVKGRSPKSFNARISEYITTNEDFKKFCKDVIDLETTDKTNSVFRICVRNIEKAEMLDSLLVEDRAIQGIEKLIETQNGKVKIGFTKIRKNLIYV